MRLAPILMCLIFGYGLISCQKELNFEPIPVTPATGDTLVRIRQGVNADITEDTVYLLYYNAEGRLSQIVDSLYQDTLNITYDLDGLMVRGKWTSGPSVNYVYNGQVLSEMNVGIFGASDKFTYEYAGGNITKSSFYTDAGTGGAQFVWLSNTYTSSNGNVNTVQEFDRNGSLQYDLLLEYGTEVNPFKQLALLNSANYLGIDRLVPNFVPFNKNIYKGFTYSAFYDSIEYTFNSNKQPVKAVLTSDVPGDILTWEFTYK